MSEVRRYWMETEGACGSRFDTDEPSVEVVLASDHESALAAEREARRVAQEDNDTLNALLNADKLIHEDLLRIRDEALAERAALRAELDSARKALATILAECDDDESETSISHHAEELARSAIAAQKDGG